MPVSMPSLIALSLSWALLGLLLALANPWLGLMSHEFQFVVNITALLVTGAFILWNFVVSIILVGRIGRTLVVLPLTIVQFVLFTLLFFQIACHQGADHYNWEELPGVWDWLWFAGAHAVKAGDVCDIIEAYGWNIQTINHASHLTSVCLIVFHFVMGVFLISLLAEGVEKIQEALRKGSPSARGISRLTWGLAGFFLIVWLVSALWVRPWRWQDVLSWPIDNLVRVIDFMDALEVYEVRLHSVPRVWWEATLTALCRVLMTVILAGCLGKIAREIRIRWLQGWGLSERELKEIHDGHTDPAVCLRVAQRLEAVRSAGAVRLGAAWMVLGSGLVSLALAGILLFFGYDWPRWNDAAVDLAESASDTDNPTADVARLSLCRMGWYAEAAVPKLSQSLPRVPREMQVSLIDTLGYLGPGAGEPLENWIGVGDEKVALSALRALGRIGPAAAPRVASKLDPAYPASVRAAARQILLKQGDKAVQPLIDAITEKNAFLWMPVLSDLTPYWHLYTSRNRYFMELRQIRDLVYRLGDEESMVRARAAETLGEIGPAAINALPDLVMQLSDVDPTVRSAVAAALGKIDKNWRKSPVAQEAKPVLIKRLTDVKSGIHPKARSAIAEALRTIDQDWSNSHAVRQAVPSLVMRLGADDFGHYPAAQALGEIGPAAASALPDLIRQLSFGAPKARSTAIEALRKIDKDWGKSPATRTIVPFLVSNLDIRMNLNHSKRFTTEELKRLDVFDEEILKEIGAPAVPDLVMGLANKNGFVRSRIAGVLESIDPNWRKSSAARQAVPGLVKRLADKDHAVRAAAAEALGIIGEAAVSAIPVLIARLADKNVAVKDAAERALDQIDKGRRERKGK